MLFKKGTSCPIFIASGIKEIKYFLLTIFSLILYFSSITVTFWGKNREYKWGRIYFKYITFCLCNKSRKISVTEFCSAKFEYTSQQMQ